MSAGQIVLIESPYAPSETHSTAQHVEYAYKAMRDCIKRGEIPLAGHLLYTQILDDTIPEQRKIGIQLHCELIRAITRQVVYTDLGITKGMDQGIIYARQYNVPIEFRRLGVC